MSSSSRNSNNRNVRGPSTAADVFSSFSQDFATISNSLPVPGRVDLKSILKEASSLAQKGILDFVDADRLRKEEEEKQKNNSNISGGGGGGSSLHAVDDTSSSIRMDTNSDYRVVVPPKPVVLRSAADEAESLLLADLKAAGIEYSRNDQLMNSSSSLSSGSSQLPTSSSTSTSASLQNVQDSVFRTAEDLLSKASDQFNNAAANLPAVRDELLSQWQRRIFSSVGAGGMISLSSQAGGSGQAPTGGLAGGQDTDEIKVKKLSILPSSIPISSTLSTRPLNGMLNPASLSSASSASNTSTCGACLNSCSLITRFAAFIAEVTLVVIKFIGRIFINISMRLVGRAGSGDVVLSPTVESTAGFTLIGLLALLYYYFFTMSVTAPPV
jgi:hypothetical protein